ncbi:hypothetical protein [Hyphomonas sp.]|uniref:hypothetical protein n=1 Tax=Hyphomonas sp. TaxID=87 RepID=UPI003918F177
MFSRLLPAPGLSPLQLLLWPLIWLQLVALKHVIRRHYGRGVPYLVVISRFGFVEIARIAAEYRESVIPGHLVPGPAPAPKPVSARLRQLAAILTDARACVPAPLLAVPAFAGPQTGAQTLTPDTS